MFCIVLYVPMSFIELNVPIFRIILDESIFRFVLDEYVFRIVLDESVFRIVLDESVIPQKYSRVLVRALYVDSIDFDLVDDRSLEIGDR